MGLLLSYKNKNVLIDKPFTINFKQTQKLINLAKEKVILSEAIVFQKHRQFKKFFFIKYEKNLFRE